MTTDPGDLVFDPTCGSGTTAYVAEQWGRRWITCDTSRVAISITRRRLMTATFPWFMLAQPRVGVTAGFQCKVVPHVKLKNIALNIPAYGEMLVDDPVEDLDKTRVAGPFTVEEIPPLNLETKAADSPADSTEDAQDFGKLVTHLQQNAIIFPNGKKLTLRDLTSQNSGVIHAVGEVERSNIWQRVAVSFGLPFSSIGPIQIEQAITEVGHDSDLLLIAGSNFTPEAEAFTWNLKTPSPHVELVLVNPDVMFDDVLVPGKESQIFTVIGKPVIHLVPNLENTQVSLEIEGILTIDPKTGEGDQIPAGDLVAWLIDEDYDGQYFRACQASFPRGKNYWQKLQRSLRGTMAEEDFALLKGTSSRPFPALPDHQIAVKVIDFRGIEAVIVLNVNS